VNPLAPTVAPVRTVLDENSPSQQIPLLLTGEVASVAVADPPAHGAATVSGQTISYAPAAGYSGPDTFTYTASNGTGTSSPASVSILVRPLAPSVADVSATVLENTDSQPIPLAVAGAADRIAITRAPSHGAARVLGTTIVYAPDRGYAGPDSFGYAAANETGASQQATVSVTVNPLAPAAMAVNATVSENSAAQPVSLAIRGEATSVAVATPPSHGTATVEGTTIAYAPAEGYSGPDSFTYTAANVTGTSDPAVASITVRALAPTAGDVSATIAEDAPTQPINLAVTGEATRVSVTSAPRHGVARASGTAILYAPDAGYTGLDSFAYTAANATGTSSPGLVSITVNPRAPTVAAVSATFAENAPTQPVPLAIAGQAASVSVTAEPSHGEATAEGTTILYAPDQGYSGPDSFTYTATNMGGTSDPATVSILVSPLAPTVADVSATVGGNAPTQPVPLAIAGQAASVAIAAQPAHGVATADRTTITYTPAEGYAGPDSFTYTATNTTGTSAPATVSITVNPLAPTVAAVSATVAENAGSQPVPLAIAGQAASVAVSSQPMHGAATVDGTTIAYAPASGYAGVDSFTYTATNATGTSSPATVSITVTPLAPTVAAVIATVPENAVSRPIPLAITGLATNVAVSSQPSHGAAAVDGTRISYTPFGGYAGQDSFSYTATNATGTSSPATVSIIVSPPAPTVSAVSATVPQNAESQPIDLAIRGEATSVAVARRPRHGVATANGTTIAYAPVGGYVGPDSFTYTATNATGASSPATVSITVSRAIRATPPIVSAVSATLSENAGSQTIRLAIKGNASSVAVADPAEHGIATATGTTIDYVPIEGYSGPDSFSYTATNAAGTSRPATVSITVNPLAPPTPPTETPAPANAPPAPAPLAATSAPSETPSPSPPAAPASPPAGGNGPGPAVATNAPTAPATSAAPAAGAGPTADQAQFLGPITHIYTSGAAQTEVVPFHAHEVTITVDGGGGSGATGVRTQTGGGGGARAVKTIPVVAGDTFTFTVGQGGAAIVGSGAPAPGRAGGDSQVTGHVAGGAVDLVGGGGYGGSPSGRGGAGGAALGGDTNTPGSPAAGLRGGAAGGGAAGEGMDGGNGARGDSPGGGGGAGNTTPGDESGGGGGGQVTFEYH